VTHLYKVMPGLVMATAWLGLGLALPLARPSRDKLSKPSTLRHYDWRKNDRASLWLAALNHRTD